SQFGVPVITFRGLHEMFVDMTITVQAARALVLDVSRKIDDHKKSDLKVDVTGLSGIAKVIGSEAGRITLDALQATGGYGYMNETPFPKLVRDFKIFEIFEGTNQIQREQISLQLIKEFGKGNWADRHVAEMKEIQARVPHVGAACLAGLRRAFDATLELLLSEEDTALGSDQYHRFIMADTLIELETAQAFTRAVSRLEENNTQDYHNLSARIYAQEVLLRNLYRIQRLLVGAGGDRLLKALEEKVAPLNELALETKSLLRDRRALGAILVENPA
ncbi:MAG: hypothetical protein KJ645_00170, partial [Planctomycetes bacterium]|nr:hypothetical protein [Planctomycetota bacterium]